MKMAEPFTFNMSPTFGALMGQPVEEKIAAYRDASWRREGAGGARVGPLLPHPSGTA